MEDLQLNQENQAQTVSKNTTSAAGESITGCIVQKMEKYQMPM